MAAPLWPLSMYSRYQHIDLTPLFRGEKTQSGVSKGDAGAQTTCSDQNDNRAAFSNHGPEVNCAAPGVDIYST
jgi:hypothetical protein